MADPRLENLAKILVDYSTEVKQGEWVMIRSNIVALPLVRETVRNVLRAGGHPTVIYEDDDLNEIIQSESSDQQLEWISPLEKAGIENIDVLIRLGAAANTRVLMGVDPQRSRLRLQARQQFMKVYKQRVAQGELRWVGTHYPCQAYAQEADMSLREYQDFVYSATFADQPDPVARWQAVHDEQQRLVDWLAGKKEVVLKGSNVELTLSIDGRKFINSDGKTNMPSGEIFTSPVEDSANGWIRFSYPAIRLGREVEGIELEFQGGKVVTARAKKNQEYLNTMLDSDEGARYLGEFAIGTNYAIQRFTKNTLYDEKIGGTIHLALGAGFHKAGSQNESAIHWDMVCDMRQDGEIWVDGALIHKNGQFQI